VAIDVGSVLRRPRPRRPLLPAVPTAPAAPLLLIGNANSSGVNGDSIVLEHARAALERAGAEVDGRLTESLGELAAALATAEERRVVLLGGDGTLHALANLPGRKPELALLPAGGANNVARSLGVPRDLKAAAELAVYGQARSIDVILATSATRRYAAVEGVSVGFHAQARTMYRAANSADVSEGLRAGVGGLLQFKPVELTIESDGRSETQVLSQLFVLNTPRFAFGLHAAPSADPSDGLLDIVAVPARGRLSLLGALAHLRRGTHLDLPGIRTWRARQIRLFPERPSPVIADTTALGSGPVELAVQRDALRIVAPTA
jgi:diacylglycerol kinase (ATP)